MRLTVVVVVLGVVSASLANGSVLVGSPATSNNCLPFGCPSTFTVTQYQQLYAPADFPGPITITGLTFFNTQLNNGSTLSTGTFTLSLSTVSASVGTFNSLIPVGADNTQIFSGTLGSVPFGGSFTLGNSSFAYNPVNGSLLLNVQISGVSSTSGIGLDASDGLINTFSRATNGSNAVTVGTGLVTRFETSTANTPEPTTLSVSWLGMILVGGLAARRTLLSQGLWRN